MFLCVFWKKNCHEIGKMIWNCKWKFEIFWNWLELELELTRLWKPERNWNWQFLFSKNWLELELELTGFWNLERIGIGIEWFLKIRKELELELTCFLELINNPSCRRLYQMAQPNFSYIRRQRKGGTVLYISISAFLNFFWIFL